MRTQVKRAETARPGGHVDRGQAAVADGAYAGNSATEGYLRSMTVSGPGDTAEVEAERNARAVMTRLEGDSVHRDTGDSGGGFQAPADVSAGIDAASRGPSGSLPGELSGRMSAAMGTSFDHVRVHDDPEAHAMSASIRANAFTTGGDVFFGAGQYRPDTPEGRQLIAHELTHVAQDSGMIFRNTGQTQPNATSSAQASNSNAAPSNTTQETEEERKKREEREAKEKAEKEAKQRKEDSKNDLPNLPGSFTKLRDSLKSPIMRRVVLALLRIREKNVTINPTDLEKGVDWKDAVDLASAGAGLVGNVSDTAGVGLDAGDVDYGGNITDMVSGTAGMVGNAGSFSTSVGGSIEGGKQDKAALEALGEDAEGLKSGKDYESSANKGTTLLRGGGAALGFGGSAMGTIGGAMGARAKAKDDDDLETAAGVVGTVGAGLSTLGSGMGAAADLSDYFGTFGGHTNKKFEEYKKLFGTYEGKPAKPGVDAEIDLVNKYLAYSLAKKNNKGQMDDFVYVIKEWKGPASKEDEVGKVKRNASKMVPLLQAHHSKSKGRKSAGLDALLSSADTLGGVFGTVGTGLTSFLKNGQGGHTAGLVFRGIATLMSFGVNAINAGRKGKKIANSSNDARQQKYADRVNGILDSFKSLPGVGLDNMDIAFFGTKGMSGPGQTKALDENDADVANLADYVDMVDSLSEQVKMLHLAAAVEPKDRSEDLSPEERSRVANALAEGLGK